MYVAPQSNFRILRRVPFNSDMKHTIYFGSKSEQTNYFVSKTKYNCTNFTYIRQSNTIKVEILADNLYDCNYCMFKNSAFGDKWFYAFITKIQYVSNNVTEITFLIDQYQTWLFETSIGKCFVEREHVADDTIGKHTVPEPVDIGENVIQSNCNLYFGNGADIEDNVWSVKITATPSLADSVLLGNWSTEVMGHQVTGTTMMWEVSSDAEAVQGLNNWLNAQSALGNRITDMTMFPKFFSSSTYYQATYMPMEHGVSRPTSFYQPLMSEVDYKPKNNKLLTYPYTYMKVSNNQGAEVDYKWENMPEGTLRFTLFHNVVNSVACELRANGYEHSANRLMSIPINNFPSVSFIQNTGIFEVLKGLSSSLAGGLSGLSTLGNAPQSSNKGSVQTSTTDTTRYNKQGEMTGTSTSSRVSVRTPIEDEEDYYIPSIDYSFLDVLGSSTSHVTSGSQGNLDVRWNTYGYSFYTMAIKAEYAKLIDDYFTRYGYKVNEYKVPEMNTRSAFNFVKTIDCNVIGDAPNEALEVISEMFDKGVTLWHTYDVGNYGVYNRIVSKGE